MARETPIYSSFLRRQEPSGLKHPEDTGFLPAQERREFAFRINLRAPGVRVKWQPHPALYLAPALRDWLTEPASLTARLQAHSRSFRVQRLAQYAGAASREEQALLGLRAAKPVVCREVVLLCDGIPVVCARTIVSRRALQRDWPFFHGLGHRSLGARLFVDPLVQRLPMRYATLTPGHPLYTYAQRTAPGVPRLQARSSVFSRGRGKMLVTEIFLPSLLNLKEAPHATE